MKTEAKPLEVSPRDYHSKLTLDRENIFSADSWLSKSSLWQLKNNSLYRWRFAPKQFAGSDAADWGTIVDCLITTPEELDAIVSINPYDNFRTNAAKDLRDECQAAGKILIQESTLDLANQAAKKLISHRAAAPIIERSKKQVVLLNKLKGVNFKGLVDLAPEGWPILCDLKTTGKFSFSDFGKTIDNLGYHVQAGIYLKLWNLCFPDDHRDRFQFVWQESSPPFEIAVTELPGMDISIGEEWAAHQLDRLTKAAEKDYWPDLAEGKTVMVGRPGYAAFRDDEDFDGPVFAPSIGKEAA